MIKLGTICKYKPFNEWIPGVVCAGLDDGKFCVTDGVIKIAQYDDSLRTYSLEDIGTKVIFEEVK